MKRIIRKIKNGYELRIGNNAIRFTNPMVQSFDETEYEGREDILHFYYDVEILRKVYSGEKIRYASVIKANIYEFGIMPCIEKFIDNILEFDTQNNAPREYFYEDEEKKILSNNEFEAVKNWELAGMLDEDRIDVSAKYRQFTDYRGFNKFLWYDVSIFAGGNENGDCAVGIKLSNLKKEDLLSIKRLAELFMALTDKRAKEHAERYKKHLEAKKGEDE